MSLADRKISLAGEAKQQPQDGWSDLSAVARRAKAEAIPIASRINSGSEGLKLALIWARRIRAGVFVTIDPDRGRDNGRRDRVLPNPSQAAEIWIGTCRALLTTFGAPSG
jgi:hypothetical protein